MTRYAIYAAPHSASPLWKRAAQWIGRDAATNVADSADSSCGIPIERLKTLTTSARRYGFHATLKAPFHLASDLDLDALIAQAKAFACKRPPLRPLQMEVQMLGGFVALMPIEQTDELADFAAACVTEFDFLRAPMTSADRERRLGSHLTPHQITLLDQYGYPYVLDQFRMHMTLTDKIPEDEQAGILQAARAWMQPALDEAFVIDTLAIFEEPVPGAAFRRIVDIALASSAHANGA